MSSPSELVDLHHSLHQSQMSVSRLTTELTIRILQIQEREAVLASRMKVGQGTLKPQ